MAYKQGCAYNADVKLKTIGYCANKDDKGDSKALTGIQLGFTDGARTEKFQTLNSRMKGQQLTTVELDTTKTVRYICMRVFFGCLVRGLKLIDDFGKELVDLNWYTGDQPGEWVTKRVPD